MFETVTLVVLASVDDTSLISDGAGNGGLHGVSDGCDVIVMPQAEDDPMRGDGIVAVLTVDDKVRVHGRADPG